MHALWLPQIPSLSILLPLLPCPLPERILSQAPNFSPFSCISISHTSCSLGIPKLLTPVRWKRYLTSCLFLWVECSWFCLFIFWNYVGCNMWICAATSVAEAEPLYSTPIQTTKGCQKRVVSLTSSLPIQRVGCALLHLDTELWKLSLRRS